MFVHTNFGRYEYFSRSRKIRIIKILLIYHLTTRTSHFHIQSTHDAMKMVKFVIYFITLKFHYIEIRS